MVGYDENASKRLSDSEYAIAGAAAGGVTRAICQPLDVVKIRFQVKSPFDCNTLCHTFLLCLHVKYCFYLIFFSFYSFSFKLSH